MKTKLIAFNYQRNGVAGTDFWAAILQNLSNTKGKFLATFETTDKDNITEIDYSSCRVVMLEGNVKNTFYECWRGDRIASEIQVLIDTEVERTNVESWYDLHQLYENKATGSTLDVRYNQITVAETYSESINAL